MKPVIPLLLLLLCAGCMSKAPTPVPESPAGMTPKLWSEFLKNIPKDRRSEIIEKLDRLHETAVARWLCVDEGAKVVRETGYIPIGRNR